MAWVKPTDGLLALDRNNNGKIDGFSELFGNASTDGFDVLRTLDTNKDGKISAADASFSKLVVWQDANGDGVAQAAEVKALSSYGIKEISLATTASGVWIAGTQIGNIAGVTYTNGTSKTIGSAYFGRKPDAAMYRDWETDRKSGV